MQALEAADRLQQRLKDKEEAADVERRLHRLEREATEKQLRQAAAEREAQRLFEERREELVKQREAQLQEDLKRMERERELQEVEATLRRQELAAATARATAAASATTATTTTTTKTEVKGSTEGLRPNTEAEEEEVTAKQLATIGVQTTPPQVNFPRFGEATVRLPDLDTNLRVVDSPSHFEAWAHLPKQNHDALITPEREYQIGDSLSPSSLSSSVACSELSEGEVLLGRGDTLSPGELCAVNMPHLVRGAHGDWRYQKYGDFSAVSAAALSCLRERFGSHPFGFVSTGGSFLKL